MLEWSRESSDVPVVRVRPVYIDLIDWASGVSVAGQMGQLGTALEEIDEGGSTLHHAVWFCLYFWHMKRKSSIKVEGNSISGGC